MSHQVHGSNQCSCLQPSARGKLDWVHFLYSCVDKAPTISKYLNNTNLPKVPTRMYAAARAGVRIPFQAQALHGFLQRILWRPRSFAGWLAFPLPFPPLWLIICFSPLLACYSATSCLSATPQTLQGQRLTMPSWICALVGLSSSCTCFLKSWAIALWTNSYCSWDVTAEKSRTIQAPKQHWNSDLYCVVEWLWESILFPGSQ